MEGRRAVVRPLEDARATASTATTMSPTSGVRSRAARSTAAVLQARGYTRDADGHDRLHARMAGVLERFAEAKAAFFRSRALLTAP